MFHFIENNVLYDLVTKTKITVEVIGDKLEYDTCNLMNDVSLWMAENQDKYTDKYFPLAVLCVGLDPTQISAFLYGIFIERAFKKYGLKISIKTEPLNTEEIVEKIKEDGGKYRDILKDLIKSKPKKRKINARKKRS